MLVIKHSVNLLYDRLRGLVVRVPGFDSRRYQIFWEVGGLELSIVRIIEELIERKIAAPF
jgi:hypothetical protein